ncbi:MAG: alpha/beta fold hydrolase, partial [Myxococcota bacterium]
MSIEVLSVGDVPTTAVRFISASAKALVLIIPGNPGVARMYLPFVQRMHATAEGRLSVAIAGHAGHAPGHPSPKGYFGLDDQLEHHRRFLASLDSIERHVRDDQSSVVHVVGHSIGAWLGLKLFDTLPTHRRGRAFLLFPAIEHLAKTPSGRRMSPLFGSMRSSTVAFARLLRNLPGRDWFLSRYILYEARPEVRALMLEGLLEISGTGLNNVLRMAKEEMDQVADPPEALLRRHA